MRLISLQDLIANLANAKNESKCELAILLKFKDEPDDLRQWVSHHRNIVGYTNLIIIDNNSEDPGVHSLLCDLSEKGAMCCRYEGFHNNLHRPDKVPFLYDYLRNHYKFFCFLDLDERLVMINGAFDVLGDERIVDLLSCSDDEKSYPGVWVNNARGSFKDFLVDEKSNNLSAGARSGKPVLNANLYRTGIVNHNWQLQGEKWGKIVDHVFFVLHLKNLSPIKRISANYKKLIAYNAFKGFPGPLSMEECLLVDPCLFPEGNKRNWIAEIQFLNSLNASSFKETESPRARSIRLVPGSRVVFPEEDTRKLLHDFINSFGLFDSSGASGKPVMIERE